MIRFLNFKLILDVRKSTLQLAAKMTDDMLLADAEQENRDKLPMTEILDLVKDWKSIVETFKDNMCRKASQIYIKRKFETELRRKVDDDTK